jgi:sterol 24-C-methyltransferase
MSPIALEKEDHARDKDFAKALHGQTTSSQGISAILGKDRSAQKAAVDEYFKHWDNKPAETETDETREARKAEYATLTRQYVACVN